MKKLFFASVIALGTLGTVTANTPIFHDGIMDEVLQDTFKEITVDALPTEVTDALKKDFEGAVVDKAYINDKSNYKLEVTLADGSAKELLVDAEGNWIE